MKKKNPCQKNHHNRQRKQRPRTQRINSCHLTDVNMVVVANQRADRNILVVLRDVHDTCEPFEVWRRPIHVEVLPIERGTFDGLTPELTMGFGGLHRENAVIGGLGGRRQHGNERARQRHSQCLKLLRPRQAALAAKLKRANVYARGLVSPSCQITARSASPPLPSKAKELTPMTPFSVLSHPSEHTFKGLCVLPCRLIGC